LNIETRWLRVERAEARDRSIEEAARLLGAGKLVAFPTETVYGLGARVGDESAVRAVFRAKGRPAAVPLIVHVRDIQQARRYVREMPEVVEELARKYWPGPLTVVLDRSEQVPDAVTAGGGTVGIRVPDHPVALALIDALGEGIAAPSANPYGRLPPVRGEHVIHALGGRIDAVLDGGPCRGGLESTVIDARILPAVLLRRGAMDPRQLGISLVERVVTEYWAFDGWIRVGPSSEYARWAARLGALKVGRMGEPEMSRKPSDVASYARWLYEGLHELWAQGCARVWVDAPPRGPEWEPIWDRLARLSKLSPPDCPPD